MAIAKSLTLLMKLKTDDFQQGLKGAERSAGRAADSITKSGKRAEKSWRDVGSAVTSLKGLFAKLAETVKRLNTHIPDAETTKN